LVGAKYHQIDKEPIILYDEVIIIKGMMIMRNAYNWMNNMMYNRRIGNDYDYNRINSCFTPIRMIGMLIFIALIILVISLLVRNRRGYSANNSNESEAMSILRTRFARSEISEEEFNQKKELLQRKVK